MCEYGLIPQLKTKASDAESGIQSSFRTDLQDVNNSQRSLSVLTDNVDVPQCPNSDLHAELEN